MTRARVSSITRRAWFRAAACIAVAAAGLFTGCGGGESSEPGTGADGPPPELAARLAVDLGPDRTPAGLFRVGDPSVPFMLAGHMFRGKSESAAPVRLSRPLVMEFYPVHLSEGGDAARLVVTLIDRGEEHVLHDGPLFELDEESAAEGARTGLFDQPVRLDLMPWAGRLVRFRWELPGAPDDFCLLADLELRPPTDAARLPPDVLLICSDTHRADRSVAGAGPALMPRLAEFARESVVYSDARSNASWTLPSITSALTGLPPAFHRTGFRVRFGRIDEIGDEPVGPGLFAAPWTEFTSELTAYPAALTTLPEALVSLGYTTALVAANPFYYLSGLHADGFNIGFNLTSRDAAEVHARAAELIDRLPRDRPLFLAVHYIDVHDFKIRRFRSHGSDMEAFSLPPAEINALYDEAVREFDAHLGRLLDKWDSVRGRDSSLVIFYSDHGEHLMDPGHPDPAALRAGFGDDPWADYRMIAAPVLGHGNSMHESLLRVPLVIRYPKSAGVTPGASPGAVSLIDIMPTVLDVAGAGRYAPAAEAPGAAVSLRRSRGRDDPARPVISDFQLFGDQMTSVRAGRWKLVRNSDAGSVEVFDTASAPPDGAAEPPPAKGTAESETALRELGAVLERYEAAAEAATSDLRSAHEADPDEVTRDLRKLGYVK